MLRNNSRNSGRTPRAHNNLSKQYRDQLFKRGSYARSTYTPPAPTGFQPKHLWFGIAGLSAAAGGGILFHKFALPGIIAKYGVAKSAILASAAKKSTHSNLPAVLAIPPLAPESTKNVLSELKKITSLAYNKSKSGKQDRDEGQNEDERRQSEERAARNESFIWMTQGDDRVRDSHRDLHNRVFTYKDGAGGLFPGTEYGCRCIAVPISDADDIQ